MKRSVVFVLIAFLLLAACSPQAPTQAQETPAQAQPTSTSAPTATEPPNVDVQPVGTATPAAPTPYETGIAPPTAALEAQKALAQRLGVAVDAIRIQTIEQVQWPNGCLGAARPGEMCTQAIVDGYRVVLEVNGQTYEYHTNNNGSLLRMLEPAGGKGQDVLPDAVKKVQALLAQQLGMEQTQVAVIAFDAVEWPNACLGVEKPDQMCAAVITPGFDVTLQASGQQYNFHTDESGGVIVPAPVDQALKSTVLTWEQEADGVCTRMEIDEKGLSTGECGETPQVSALNPAWLKDLSALISAYASFDAETPAGTIQFAGQGKKAPTAAEQRSVAEWARMVQMLGAPGAEVDENLGVAFRWQREGGIAGFCDELTVYRDGYAVVDRCNDDPAAGETRFRLEAEQLAALYQWLDATSAFTLEQKDPVGAADAMSVELEFFGSGQKQAVAPDQAQIANFAQEVFNSLTR